jgi:hypothetical protein
MEKKIDDQKDLTSLLQETKYAFMPNPTLFGSRRIETIVHDDDDDDDDGEEVKEEVKEALKEEKVVKKRVPTKSPRRTPRHQKSNDQPMTPLRRSHRLQEKEHGAVD